MERLMPKKCIALGCILDVFSHNYCQGHQYLRSDEKWLKKAQKVPKKRFKIKPISEKQGRKLRLYEQGKKDKEKHLKETDQWNCIFCGEPIGDDIDIGWHHLLGRDGDLVSDMRYIFPAHTYCHIVIYHWGNYDLLSSQRWYNKFLERIKKIDTKLYNKEIGKGEKS